MIAKGSGQTYNSAGGQEPFDKTLNDGRSGKAGNFGYILAISGKASSFVSGDRRQTGIP
jgi:hypothetical protein